ncbi:MAG: phytoene desaturase [Alphaproteobacteria bacterium]|nr:MAG: phytoene desaturase [Alphaproteobacteria bacterium]
MPWFRQSKRSVTTPHTVIIGAGPGGLAAAMLLAARGVRVTIVERLDHVGGRSGAIETPEGYRFDRGPTFFLYPQILREIFAACGRSLDTEVDLRRVDPLYRLMFEDGGTLDVASDPGRLRAAVATLSPGDAANIDRYMTDNRQKLAAFAPILQRPMQSVFDLMHPTMLAALPKLRPHRTVDGDLARYFSDERVRLAFSFQSKYLGMSPFKCPSLFTILSFMEHEHGIWHPIGGCNAVVQAMARVARSMGVDIRLSDPVEAIQFEGRRAVGVKTATAEIACDALVVNADFANTMAQLVPNALRRRWTNQRLNRAKFSCSTYMLYLGLEGREEGLAHHTIRLAADYRDNIRAIEDGDRLPDNPSFYVQNACVTDPSLAPPGHSALYLLIPVGNLSGGLDWTALGDRYRSVAIRCLESVGVRDVERRIRAERRLTPLDWQTDLSVHHGATFNLAHTMDQMLLFRPRNRFDDLDGVYLVGGGTHPGSGLPVIFESARITTSLMAKDFGLANLPDASSHPVTDHDRSPIAATQGAE